MKVRTIVYLLLVVVSAAPHSALSQQKEIVKKRGYTLIFVNYDKAFDVKVKERMIKTSGIGEGV
jgi:hypothetical protein